MPPLMVLEPPVRSRLDESFRRGDVPTIDVSEFERATDFGREIDLVPLERVIDEAMRRFVSRPEQSDSWLAPRIHAALRLNRREAALRGAWYYLNVTYRPDYVRWRFTAKKGGPAQGIIPYDRFLGEDSTNAFGRLWWAAELTRNGGDYWLSQEVMRSTRFTTSWQGLDAMHHRPAALAVARFLTTGNQGEPLSDVASQRLAKAFNLSLSTLSIDAISPNPAGDPAIVSRWCREPIDVESFFDQLPSGPPEPVVPDHRVEPIVELLKSLASQLRLLEKSLAPEAPDQP